MPDEQRPYTPGFARGTTRVILNGAIDAALLAVEVYNKPRTSFRVQTYISMMVIAWTRLFHAHFHRNIGDRYYEKDNRGRFKIVNGEKRAWDLLTCINEFRANEESMSLFNLTEPIIANIKLFIPLRNKVEHKQLDKDDLEMLLFGECQSLLFNFESAITSLFGPQYALNENLVYALQFSATRTKDQKTAHKKSISPEMRDIVRFVHTYRNSLDATVYDSQEYMIKLLQIPKVSNTNRNDLAIEFVNYNDLTDEEKGNVEQLTVLIKDKQNIVPVLNHELLRPSSVAKRVNENVEEEITTAFHARLWSVFDVRPSSRSLTPEKTNSKYCIYDSLNGNYGYTDEWVDFLIAAFNVHGLTKERVMQLYSRHKKLDPASFS